MAGKAKDRTGEEILEVIGRLGISQRTLAKRAGLPDPEVSALLHGGQPGKLERLNVALNEILREAAGIPRF